MTENFADRISRYCVLHSIIPETDREVMSYLLFQIFAIIQQILALALVAFVLKSAMQALMFALFFCVLKFHAGGAHANRHWTCLAIFTVLTAGVCLLCKFVVLPVYVSVGISMVTIVLVLLKAPIIHPNNPKPPRVKKQMRKISIGISICQCILIALGIDFGVTAVLPAALGGLMAAITLVLPLPTEES